VGELAAAQDLGLTERKKFKPLFQFLKIHLPLALSLT
jgi:hypothetical protein